MPIYRYLCKECGEALEVHAKMSDPAPEACPHCGAKNGLERQVARTAFQLKGGGWYAQGYGSAGSATKSSGGSCSGCAGGSCSAS